MIPDHVMNWANDVLEGEELFDWRVVSVASGPSVCVRDAKELWIEPCSQEWRLKEIILHEVAHAKHHWHKGCGDEQSHDREYYRLYIQLLDDWVLGMSEVAFTDEVDWPRGVQLLARLIHRLHGELVDIAEGLSPVLEAIAPLVSVKDLKDEDEDEDAVEM